MVKTALLFPGQGSQYVGMGKEFYEDFPIARKMYDEAAEILGVDIASLSFNGPADTLNLTENTQPAILAHSIIALKTLGDHGIETVAAGHSLGEYSALVAAGALEFKDALGLVQKRGRFMQEAVPLGEGAMAAILGLPLDQIQNLCQEYSRANNIVETANINSPEQTVIAGHKNAVRLVADFAEKAGAKRIIMLPVSAPFHCHLMKPAELKLQVELKKTNFKPLKFNVITNVDARLVNDGDVARDSLRRQVCSPVRWVETMEVLLSKGVKRVIEFGPGRVLSSLMKKFDKTVECLQVNNRESLEKTLSTLK
tara:strand:- start:1654 stop:2586 length:933 start_codon:yes stop_codon:yes gene_type:complete